MMQDTTKLLKISSSICHHKVLWRSLHPKHFKNSEIKKKKRFYHFYIEFLIQIS